jgi:hypothetical protein
VKQREEVEMWRTVVCGICLVIVASLGFATPPTKITISFDSATLTATGISPGGNAVWFGVAIDRHWGDNRIIRRQAIVTASADGVATFVLPAAPPALSLWTIVDPTSGEYAAATPGKAAPAEIPFPMQAVLNGSQGKPAILASQSDLMAVLVARPGVGAWVLTVRRGEPLDVGHGADKLTRVDISSMRPVGSSPAPPSELQHGDVIVVINPLEMNYFAGPYHGPN